MRSFFSIVTAIGLTVGLISCENCGPTAEPVTTLTITTTVPTRVDTVFAPGSLRPLPAQPSSTTGTTMFHQLTLPINLTTDSTRYVFRIDGRQDTVTVYYRRKIMYRNRNCGYVLDLYPPLSGEKVRTSQGEVSQVGYLQNTDGKGFWTPSQDTGIQLFLQL